MPDVRGIGEVSLSVGCRSLQREVIRALLPASERRARAFLERAGLSSMSGILSPAAGPSDPD